MAQSQEDKPYTTRSTADLDLERRLSDDYVSDSDIRGNSVQLNPNPFGDEAYAGTDPIYQNYAEEVHKPLESKKGAFKAAEDHVKDLHKDEKEADDPGLGGKAAVAGSPDLVPDRYLVPGQKGYKAPEEGAPMRVPVNQDNEDDDDSVTETDNPGTNMGASVPPPAPKKSAGSKSVDGEGDKVK
jgi:hypothetical protein